MNKQLAALVTASLLLLSPVSAETQGVSETEVIIGGHHDLQGIFAAFSVPAVKAIQLYFDKINAKGGVHGRKLKYIAEDHGNQVLLAEQAADKLINRDKIFAMLSALGTEHNLAAFKLQDLKGIPNISPMSAARQMLREPLATHYAGTPSYYDQMRKAVGLLAESDTPREICTMYTPSDFGMEVYAGSKEEAEERGLKFATETIHQPDESDFTSALSKMKAAGCDIVTMALGVRQTIAVLATAREMGIKDMKFLGSSASFHTAIAKVPGGITEGFYAAAGWQDLEARADNPVVGKWIKSYTVATGEKFPGTGALHGRASAELMVRALEAAGKELTHASFQAAMEGLEFEDKIMGNMVKMGAGDHLAADAVYVSKVEGGAWKTLATIK